MNIFPIHSEEAKRRHWVVRLLRYMATFIAVGGVVTGMVLGRGMLWPYLYEAFSVDMELGMALGGVLGALGGFLAGMLAGLPLWALALIADDLHAARLYLSGFAAYGPKDMAE